ncbi:hypothetical protein G5V57_06545 [Nordella sp. HKS 07]|uniref:hypothetical protein n=1 Tax=Nordella sp. HKS 07 TaxID=2712222 RepID=UPI0013E11B21|nr:hypothetical protein [Nordella sp. HKS 07]QIG52360.1 hypothetical protein G5V57_06545 [Nordella sp. HKS 07]
MTCAEEASSDQLHPVAIEHLPVFITAPGQTDILFNVVVGFLLLFVFLLGVFYFKLHALPEHMAHRTSKVQMEIVAVLCVISLFTHNHIYWIAALLLAMVELPDFSSPLSSMAGSLRRLAKQDDPPHPQATDSAETGVEAPPPHDVVKASKVDAGKKLSHV